MSWLNRVQHNYCKEETRNVLGIVVEQGKKKNGIGPVLCVNPRPFDRTMQMQVKELCDYLSTLLLPQLERRRKRAPNFTIRNFKFMQYYQYFVIASSFTWNRRIYCVPARSELHWLN